MMIDRSVELRRLPIFRLPRNAGDRANMGWTWPLLLAALLWTTGASADEPTESAEGLFRNICMSCHKLDREPGMIAPPLFAIKNHYLRVFPGKADFVKAVSEWLARPSADRTLMPGAVRRFNLMPLQPLSDQQRAGLAAYLFDTDFYEPGWYQQHYQQQHGDKPPGR